MGTKTNYNIFFGAVYFVILLVFLFPSAGWLDSPELISSSFLLGNGHPPGQPLYNVISKAFQMIPVGNIAFRSNLLSALMLLASMMIFLDLANKGLMSGRESSKNILSLSLILAIFLSYPFMIQGVRAEIYSLTLLLTVLILYALIAGENKLVMFFLLGLMFCLHTLLAAALFPGVLVYLIISRRGLKFWMHGFLFMVLGLSPYLYLPLRGASDVIYNFGSPENISNFIWVLTGKLYANKSYGISAGPFMLDNTLSYVGLMFRHLTPVPVIGGIAGILLMLKNKRGIAVLLLLILLLNAGILITNRHFDIFNPDANGYMIPAYLCIGFGFIYLLLRCLSMERVRSRRWITCLSAAVFLILCVYQVAMYMEDYYKNGLDNSLRFSHKITAGLPYGSSVFTGSFGTYAVLSNSIFVERYRSDLKLFYSGFIANEGYLKNMFNNYEIFSSLNPELYDRLGFELCTDVGANSTAVFIEPSIARFKNGYGVKERHLGKYLQREGWFLRFSEDIQRDTGAYRDFWLKDIPRIYKDAGYEYRKKILQGVFLHADFNLLKGDAESAKLLLEKGLELSPGFDDFIPMSTRLKIKNTL